jgi:riboflavin biosynthesis pyrimidine reductase
MLQADLIDELILKFNPVVLGGGVPFFSGEVPRKALDLISAKTYREGAVWLHYRVERP